MRKISIIRAALLSDDISKLSEILGYELDEQKMSKINSFKKKCSGEDKKNSETNMPFDILVDRIYLKNNLKYKYFPDTEKAPELFKELFIILSVMINLDSDHEIYPPIDVMDKIYDLMVLFDGSDTDIFYKNLDKFFNRNFASLKEFASFVEDIEVSKCQEFGKIPYDISKARLLLNSKTDGVKIAKNFKTMSHFKKIPHDAETFKQELFKMKYPEAHEDPELAKLCSSLDAENLGDILKGRELGFLPTENKASSSLPEMHLTFKSGSSTYHFVNLPVTNPRSQQLGNYVGNCISWPSMKGGPDVNNLIHDALHKENIGFYVIVKSSKDKLFEPKDIENLEDLGHEIVGFTPAWVGDKSINMGVLSVRSARTGNLDIKEITEVLGKKVEEEGFDRLILGGLSEVKGIRNLDLMESTHTKWNSIPAEGYKYPHFLYQHEGYISKKLVNARDELRSLTGFEDQSHIISLDQAEAIKEAMMKLQNLGGSEVFEEIYVKYTNPYIMRVWDSNELIRLISEFEKLRDEDPGLHAKLFFFDNNLNFTPATATKDYICYKFGIKVSDIYKLPKDVIEAILASDEIVRNAIVRLSDMDSFGKSLVNVDSLLALKLELIKAYARDLSKEEGDLSKVDVLEEDKCDRILKSHSLFTFGFTSISEILTLEEDVFNYLTSESFALYSQTYIMGKIPKLSELKKDTPSELQKEFLERVIEYRKDQNPKFTKFGEDFVHKLTSENLAVLTRDLCLQALFFANSLEELIKSPEEEAIIVKRRIVEAAFIGSSLFGLDKADIDYIHSLNEDDLDFVLNCKSEVAIKLTNPDIMTLLRNNKITLNDLELLDESTMYLITLHDYIFDVLDNPIQFFQSKPNLKKLLVYNHGVIKSLHQSSKLDIKNICNLDEEKASIFASMNLLELIQQDMTALENIFHFTNEQLAQINYHIIIAASNGRISFENLKECSADQLEALTFAIASYFEKVLDLDHLRCQSPEVIKAIARHIWYIKEIEVPLTQYELANHSAEKIDYIFSYENEKCDIGTFLKISKMDFYDFIEFPLEIIQILLSSYSIPYRFAKAGLNKESVENMDLEKLALILSKQMEVYTIAHFQTPLSEIANMNLDEIRELIPGEDSAELLGDG